MKHCCLKTIKSVRELNDFYNLKQRITFSWFQSFFRNWSHSERCPVHNSCWLEQIKQSRRTLTYITNMITLEFLYFLLWMKLFRLPTVFLHVCQYFCFYAGQPRWAADLLQCVCQSSDDLHLPVSSHLWVSMLPTYSSLKPLKCTQIRRTKNLTYHNAGEKYEWKYVSVLLDLVLCHCCHISCQLFLCESCFNLIFLKWPPVGENPYKVDGDRIKQRAKLLQKYLKDEQKELQALYALQGLMVQMEQPASECLSHVVCHCRYLLPLSDTLHCFVCIISFWCKT